MDDLEQIYKKINVKCGENVNHPAHYAGSKIEVIDYIEDKQLGFCLGNVIKYVSRAGKKDKSTEVEDLKKAAWYLNRRIEELQEEVKKLNKITDTSFKSVVYISHPYDGIKQNEDRIASIMKELIVKYPDNLFISPVHTFGFAYNNVSYETGILWCLWFLEKCDVMWIVGSEWKDSKGCSIEVEYCKEHNIPFRFIDKCMVDNLKENRGNK